jgi:hypothetical protein
MTQPDSTSPVNTHGCAMSTARFLLGDRVNWQRLNNKGQARGGSVPARVIGFTHKGVQICLARRVGLLWQTEIKTVVHDTLSPRSTPCPELGEAVAHSQSDSQGTK